MPYMQLLGYFKEPLKAKVRDIIIQRVSVTLSIFRCRTWGEAEQQGQDSVVQSTVACKMGMQTHLTLLRTGYRDICICLLDCKFVGSCTRAGCMGDEAPGVVSLIGNFQAAVLPCAHTR